MTVSYRLSVSWDVSPGVLQRRDKVCAEIPGDHVTLPFAGWPIERLSVALLLGVIVAAGCREHATSHLLGNCRGALRRRPSVRRTPCPGLHEPLSGSEAQPHVFRVREQELVMVGEMPVERSAQLILLLYLDKRGRPKVRIHGRPRSDRKKRFLLSAVAPSTSIRHPRKARPINWAQRGGLASGGEMSPDAEATFRRATMHAW